MCNVTREPKTSMEKSLITVDGLSGLVMAYALMRPEGLDGMTVKGLKKKFKDKRFAEGVDRQTIKEGLERLGIGTIYCNASLHRWNESPRTGIRTT